MSANGRRLRFGVLGTGSIAAEVTKALARSERCTAHAVASRDPDRAREFAVRHGVASAHDDYDALIGDPGVDVVYVATPHPQHAEWVVRAAEAGKHVLCEKPMTLDAQTTEHVIAAARTHGVFLLEAFAYHFHPQTERLLALVREGAIGDVRAVDVSFGYDMPAATRPSRCIERELGGGGILDVGCYCTSMSRRLVMAAGGPEAVEPDEVVGSAVLDPVERTDLYAMGVLRFANGILAQVACGVALRLDDHVRVYGSAGQIHVEYPCWLEGRRTAASEIRVVPSDGEEYLVDVPGGDDIFALEADGVARMLERGVDLCQGAGRESIANMRTLDRWRAAVGVRYPGEDGSS